MSMSISLKSECTVLLWGDRWWLPHHKLSVPFGDLAQAADQLAAAWPGPGRGLRLIYQPDDFETVPVTCPNGNRATFALALAEDHPVLRHPGHVWSHEPILAWKEGYNTLLHYETRPVLYALVHRLRELGFTVTTVWPMATWLNALPPDLTDAGAMTICAVHGDRFCLYRHSADGVRAVRTGRGGDVLKAVAAHLGGLATQVENEFVLYVTTDDSLVDQLAERVPIDTRHIVGIFSVWEALAKPTPLNPRHPAQLLPPVPLVTASQLITLLAVACLLLAVVLAFGPLQAIVSGQAGREREKQTLRTEVAARREQATAIHRLQAEQAELSADALPWAEWLRTLSDRLPAQVVLTRLSADLTGFQVEGGVVGELPAADWQRWHETMQPADARWTLAEAGLVKPSAAFALRGLWR